MLMAQATFPNPTHNNGLQDNMSRVRNCSQYNNLLHIRLERSKAANVTTMYLVLSDILLSSTDVSRTAVTPEFTIDNATACLVPPRSEAVDGYLSARFYR